MGNMFDEDPDFAQITPPPRPNFVEPRRPAQTTVGAQEFAESRHWIETKLKPEKLAELKEQFMLLLGERERAFYEPKMSADRLPTRFIAWAIWVMEKEITV